MWYDTTVSHHADPLSPPVTTNLFESGQAEALIFKTLEGADRRTRTVPVALCEFLDEAQRFAAARDIYDGTDIAFAQGLTVEGLSEAQMKQQAFRDKLINFWLQNPGDAHQIKLLMARNLI